MLLSYRMDRYLYLLFCFEVSNDARTRTFSSLINEKKFKKDEKYLKI